MGLYEQNQSSQDALRKLREGASHCRAAQEIAERDYAQAQMEADKWEQRYQLALKGSNQDLIRQAQFQKERYQAIASRIKALVEEQKPQAEAIKSSLGTWEKKVSEAENQGLYSKTNPNDAISISNFKPREYNLLDTEARTKNTFQEVITFEDVDEELQWLKEELLRPSGSQKPTTQIKDVQVLLAEAICKTKEAVNTAVVNKECIQKDYDKAHEEAKSWNTKAHIALKNNDDNLAIKAVLNKKVQNKIALTLQTQLQQQEVTVALLRQNLMALENINRTLANDTKL